MMMFCHRASMPDLRAAPGPGDTPPPVAGAIFLSRSGLSSSLVALTRGGATANPGTSAQPGDVMAASSLVGPGARVRRLRPLFCDLRGKTASSPGMTLVADSTGGRLVPRCAPNYRGSFGGTAPQTPRRGQALTGKRRGEA